MVRCEQQQQNCKTNFFIKCNFIKRPFLCIWILWKGFYTVEFCEKAVFPKSILWRGRNMVPNFVWINTWNVQKKITKRLRPKLNLKVRILNLSQRKLYMQIHLTVIWIKMKKTKSLQLRKKLYCKQKTTMPYTMNINITLDASCEVFDRNNGEFFCMAERKKKDEDCVKKYFYFLWTNRPPWQRTI